MLKINSQLFAIEDTLDDLVAAFLNLEVVRTYKAAQKAFLADKNLQKEISNFQHYNEDYNDQKTLLNTVRK